MPHSLSGTVNSALSLQAANDVPAELRGAWYHTSKESDITQFRDDHPDGWTFLTRSPTGGTNWGDRVLQVYIVNRTATHRLVATDNRGDQDGFEGDHPLPKWWLYLNPAEAGCLMVTIILHRTNDSAAIEQFKASKEYVELRGVAIAMLRKGAK